MLTFRFFKFIIILVTMLISTCKGEITMKFYLKHEKEGFTVCLNGINGGKRLIIRELELEDPELLSRDSIVSEIKKRIKEFFDCENVILEMDKDTEQKIFCVLKNNIESFESE